MPGHDVIVVGASAGGVEALIALASSLHADLPAAIFLVLHIPAQSPSLLPDILNRAGPLHALHPVDGEAIHSPRQITTCWLKRELYVLCAARKKIVTGPPSIPYFVQQRALMVRA